MNLHEHFAVFLRPTEGQPPLPARVIKSVQRTVDVESDYHLDPATAQYVTVAGRHVWLIPGVAGVGLVVPTGPAWRSPSDRPGEDDNYSRCSTSLTVAMSGRLRVYRSAQTMIGLVPDANTAIQVTTGSGEEMHRSVVNNMYLAESASGFRGFRVRDASGELQTFGNP